MSIVFDKYVQARNMVEDYINKELYPTDTPDYETQSIASSNFFPEDEWRLIFTTSLPDGMLYDVSMIHGQNTPKLTIYKQIELD